MRYVLVPRTFARFSRAKLCCRWNKEKNDLTKDLDTRTLGVSIDLVITFIHSRSCAGNHYISHDLSKITRKLYLTRDYTRSLL